MEHYRPILPFMMSQQIVILKQYGKDWIKIYVTLTSTALSIQLPNKKAKKKKINLLFHWCKWKDKEAFLERDNR